MLTAEQMMDTWRTLTAECVEVTFEANFLHWTPLVICRIHNDQLSCDFVEVSRTDPKQAFEDAYAEYQKVMKAQGLV